VDPHANQMSMTPWSFDQGPDGWRALDAAGDLEGAVRALRQYLNLWARGNEWHELTPWDDQSKEVKPYLLHWHLGQVLATLGQYEDAVYAMDTTVVFCEDMGFIYYARGTIAFLLGNASALAFETSRATWNREVLERLQEGLKLGKSYKDSY
jgi:hypothetical protein